MKPGDFVEARRRRAAKPKATRDKRMTAAEAAQFVRDGDTVALGGCAFARPAVALIREVLRQERRDLTVARSLMAQEAEWFLLAGAATTLLTAWMGPGLPWGLSRPQRHYVESGQVRFEEWSHLALGLRFRAGAMGMPFLPTVTMLGSDLVPLRGIQTMNCPYTGEKLALIPALFPDVALIHVHRADAFGNCQIDGYTHMDADIASAATTVLISAEEIVDNERIRHEPSRTVIPGFLVDAVVEAPFGAYPGECYGLYETDFGHFDDYAAVIAERGIDGAQEWVRQYILEPATHADYLALFDPDVLARQQQAARELVSGDPL